MIVAIVVQRRKEKRISQAVMAKDLKISRRQYQRMEAGKCKMPVEVLESVCEKLGLVLVVLEKEVLCGK